MLNYFSFFPFVMNELSQNNPQPPGIWPMQRGQYAVRRVLNNLFASDYGQRTSIRLPKMRTKSNSRSSKSSVLSSRTRKALENVITYVSTTFQNVF